MNPILQEHLESISDLCRKYRVDRLDAFGSVVTGELRPESDIDFAVQFQREGFEGAFLQLMGFKEELEIIFEREVDLVNASRIRNPVFAKEVNLTKSTLYAA